MTTYKFPKFPKPAVLFGQHFNSEDSQSLLKRLLELNQFYNSDSDLKDTSNERFLALLDVLHSFISQAISLNKKVVQLERKLLNMTIERNLRSLSVENIKTVMESEVHKSAEIANAVSKMQELFREFEKSGSLFTELFIFGAPLFLFLCGIFHTISLIALIAAADIKNLNGIATTCVLLELSGRYQRTLDWYRRKCIGTRLASCYVGGMVVPSSASWTYDWNRLTDKYKEYFDDGTSKRLLFGYIEAIEAGNLHYCISVHVQILDLVFIRFGRKRVEIVVQ